MISQFRRRRLIALLNGERKLFSGSAIDTNLCYSDPEVRDLLVSEVVSWARAHPETRYLHFWLADQPNNQCECPACRDKRPSDLYVNLLRLGFEYKNEDFYQDQNLINNTLTNPADAREWVVNSTNILFSAGNGPLISLGFNYHFF